MVAIVDLVDCRSTDETGWVPGRDRSFGNFAPGRFGWITRNVRALEPPIPARGYQRLWDWTPPAEITFAEGVACGT